MLLKSSNRMKNSILNSKKQELINTFNNWTGIKQQLSKLYSMPKDKRYISIEELEEQANILEKILVENSFDFKNEFNLQDAKWKDIQKKLSENEAAIEFITLII